MNYFSEDELRCKCGCGEYKFDVDFLQKLNAIRADCGFPLVISSGYRCVRHPIEAKKARPGEHTTGKAVDIKISGERADRLLELAYKHKILRKGVSQSDPDHSKRFIHLGMSTDFPHPALWSY